MAGWQSVRMDQCFTEMVTTQGETILPCARPKNTSRGTHRVTTVQTCVYLYSRVLHLERPYWWVLDPRTRHVEHIELRQYCVFIYSRVLHGERPYWWVLDPRTRHVEHVELQQFRLTCETGPGKMWLAAFVWMSRCGITIVLAMMTYSKNYLFHVELSCWQAKTPWKNKFIIC